MEKEKLDIDNFQLNQLLAKLLIITQKFQREHWAEQGPDFVKSKMTEWAKEHFIFPPNKEAIFVAHLTLHCLGSPSAFDKYTEL